MRSKRVRIVCDGCGSDDGTETIVKGLAKANDMSVARVHALLWEDGNDFVFEGGHVERIESA